MSSEDWAKDLAEFWKMLIEEHGTDCFLYPDCGETKDFKPKGGYKEYYQQSYYYEQRIEPRRTYKEDSFAQYHGLCLRHFKKILKVLLDDAEEWKVDHAQRQEHSLALKGRIAGGEKRLVELLDKIAVRPIPEWDYYDDIASKLLTTASALTREITNIGIGDSAEVPSVSGATPRLDDYFEAFSEYEYFAGGLLNDREAWENELEKVSGLALQILSNFTYARWAWRQINWSYLDLSVEENIENLSAKYRRQDDLYQQINVWEELAGGGVMGLIDRYTKSLVD